MEDIVEGAYCPGVGQRDNYFYVGLMYKNDLHGNSDYIINSVALKWGHAFLCLYTTVFINSTAHYAVSYTLLTNIQHILQFGVKVKFVIQFSINQAFSK